MSILDTPSHRTYSSCYRYCFGGAIATRLGSTDLFDSIVIAHPGGITAEQIKAIKVPTAWECAEGAQL